MSHRHVPRLPRLAAVAGLWLLLALAAAPAALAGPAQPEGDDTISSVPGGDPTQPAPIVRTADAGVNWIDTVLVAAVCLAVVIAATALVAAVRDRRPLPTPSA
jgi:hypothetical protein